MSKTSLLRSKNGPITRPVLTEICQICQPAFALKSKFYEAKMRFRTKLIGPKNQKREPKGSVPG